MNTVRTIGIIGVGKMGGGLARNLARDPRFEVTVHDLSAQAVEACTAVGASAAASAQDAASGRALVITSLPMPAHVTATWAAIADSLAPGALCMDVSTIDPTTARAVADALAAQGHPFVACLLGKGPAQAEAGEVPLFVGGDPEALDALGEVFAVIGDGVHRLGSVEAATAFKLVSNLIGMANLAVLAEGYELCRRAGVSAEGFVAALADTGGSSYQSMLRLPWMIEGDFAPRFPVALGLKDVRLAVDMAGQWGIGVPVGAAAMTQLASAVAHGWGGDDVNAVLKVVRPPAD
ncbi:MAG: NAD(P)-dependent oxidoreductase [Propioniciclava sp.]|uniref:NAD(P)-dependent oxidoreductase n=1 Tax=Propioniciclava sp. TaxID=2038686 RepID=UPI0039E566F6